MHYCLALLSQLNTNGLGILQGISVALKSTGVNNMQYAGESFGEGGSKIRSSLVLNMFSQEEKTPSQFSKATESLEVHTEF